MARLFSLRPADAQISHSGAAPPDTLPLAPGVHIGGDVRALAFLG
jgi:hypothetical protein